MTMPKLGIVAGGVLVVGVACLTTGYTAVARANGMARNAVLQSARQADSDDKLDLSFSEITTTLSSKSCGWYARALGDGQLSDWSPFVVLFQRGYLFTWADPQVFQPQEISASDQELAKAPPFGNATLDQTLQEMAREAAINKLSQDKRYGELKVGCLPTQPKVRS